MASQSTTETHDESEYIDTDNGRIRIKSEAEVKASRRPPVTVSGHCEQGLRSKVALLTAICLAVPNLLLARIGLSLAPHGPALRALLDAWLERHLSAKGRIRLKHKLLRLVR